MNKDLIDYEDSSFDFVPFLFHIYEVKFHKNYSTGFLSEYIF